MTGVLESRARCHWPREGSNWRKVGRLFTNGLWSFVGLGWGAGVQTILSWGGVFGNWAGAGDGGVVNRGRGRPGSLGGKSAAGGFRIFLTWSSQFMSTLRRTLSDLCYEQRRLIMPRVRAAFGICVAAALVGGCSQPSIKIDGSSTVIRITEAVTEEFAKEQPGVRVAGGRSGTGGGFKKFANGEIDICDASRPINEIEKQGVRKKTASSSSSWKSRSTASRSS